MAIKQPGNFSFKVTHDKGFGKGAVSGELAAPDPWWVRKMMSPVALVGCSCGKRKQNST